jgi:hypothetical protein
VLKILANTALLRKLEPFLLPAIVLLVGLTAFGLGRLSALDTAGPRLVITMPPGSQAAGVVEAGVLQGSGPRQSESAAGESSKKYVASKSGSKYYLPTCSGATRIKEENKVYFATIAEAQAAGYAPAANCPGL